MMPGASLRVAYEAARAWPADDAAALTWLGSDERGELDALRHPVRRRQWLAARLLGKQLLRRSGVDRPLETIEILSRDLRGVGVRPRISLVESEIDWSLSIAHSDRGVLVALLPSREDVVGVDLASPVSATSGFHRLWFSAEERHWLAPDPERRTALLWAIKEAIYKAAGGGDPWCPRDAEVFEITPERTSLAWRGVPLGAAAVEVHKIDGQIGAFVVAEKSTSTAQEAGLRPAARARGARPAFEWGLGQYGPSFSVNA